MSNKWFKDAGTLAMFGGGILVLISLDPSIGHYFKTLFILGLIATGAGYYLRKNNAIEEKITGEEKHAISVVMIIVIFVCLYAGFSIYYSVSGMKEAFDHGSQEAETFMQEQEREKGVNSKNGGQ